MSSVGKKSLYLSGNMVDQPKVMKVSSSYSIWLIKEGEPLPLSGEERLMRTGSLARYLANRGHRVTWWASTFSHAKKEYIKNEYSESVVSEGETLVLLHSPVSYRRNKSPMRMEYHARLSREFRRHAAQMERPDVIVCSWPTPQFAWEAVRYGRENGVPVVIDVRDLWPDIYYRAVPDLLRGPANLVIRMMRRRAKKTMCGAAAIVGMTDATVEWGCALAGRPRGPFDMTVHIGAERPAIDGMELEKAKSWWKQQGITDSTWNICLFSTLSKQLDLDTAIDAIAILAGDYPQVRLVVGGKGDEEQRYKEKAAGINQVVFAGWLDSVQMASLTSMSKCGLYCIKNTDDFVDTFSNKAIQYLSAGLPIINSLKGFAACIFEENACGFTYEEGDPNSCAEAIRCLVEDENTRLQMASNAENLFSHKFDSSVVNGQFEDLVRLIVERD